MYNGGYSYSVTRAQILATPMVEFAKSDQIQVAKTAKTVPEAICLAALAVIELERKFVQKRPRWRLRDTQ